VSSATLRDLCVVYLGWGGSYLATKIVVEHMPPMFSMAARYAIAACVAGAWAWCVASPRRQESSVARTGLLGIIVLGGGTGLLALGVGHVDSGLAALLYASAPVWAGLAARALGHRAMPRISALLCALLGLALIVGPDVSGNVAALAAVFGGTLCWGIGAGAASELVADLGTVRSVAIQAAFASGALVVGGIATGEDPGRFVSAPAHSYVALVLVAIVSSVMTYVAYQRLLKSGATQAAMTHAYVNPLVAILAGWLILGERLSEVQLAGGLLVILAASIQLSGLRLRFGAASLQSDPEQPR
jgi:drug/metabolite transporter (DMT)-like permease